MNNELRDKAGTGLHHPKTIDPTAAYLEQLSALVMERHTTGDDSPLRALLSEDFEMVNDTIHECPLPSAANLEEHLENVEALKRASPDWKVYVTNLTANMDKSDHAVVWLTARGCDSAHDPMFNRESVSILNWRKRKGDGVWVCYRHRSIRGGGDFYT